MPRKIRADQLLVDQGLVDNRSRARALIMAGKVFLGDTRVDKPGQQLQADASLRLKTPDHPWVSRGGLKLARALDTFHVDPREMVVLDIGASTGGFTQVALTRGAAKVYAVDVGRGQLAWELRQDPRVAVLEGTNARYLTSEMIPEAPDLIVCDASFISLTTILPAALDLAASGTHLIALIKPQFEVGKGQVGKGGVVRDTALHQEVCQRIRDWLDARPGWRVEGITESPIRGPEGNVEFLIHAVYEPPGHDADKS